MEPPSARREYQMIRELPVQPVALWQQSESDARCYMGQWGRFDLLMRL